MAYAELSDVQALMAKLPLTDSTTPTSAQATTLIGQVSAEIDSVIAAAGYAVPVTSPGWFVTALKLLNAEGAASRILRAMFPQSRAATDGSPSEYALYARNYADGLRRLQGGNGIPPDAVTNSGSIGPSTYFTRNPMQEEDLGDISEPTFKRSQVL